MKLNLLRVFTLCFFVFSFVSCDDNEDPIVYDFEMDSSSVWKITQNRTSVFSIIKGNGDYTFEMEDDRVIYAKFNGDYSGFGVIEVIGRRAGETVLSITDNVTQTTIDVEVKVTDDYLAYIITESEHPGLVEERVAYLISNDRNDVYFYDGEKQVAQGSYEFAVENGIRYMSLWYADHGDGKITDAAIEKTEHRFDITKNSPAAFGWLATVLSINWDELSSPRANVTLPTYLAMKDLNTDSWITGELSYYKDLPEGLLD